MIAAAPRGVPHSVRPSTKAAGIADIVRDFFLDYHRKLANNCLCAMGATDSLKTAVERSKVLMTVEQHSDATAAVKT